jgi:hypothetical protein
VSNSITETKEVQEYILMMNDESGVQHEVHLIDTPGFDDDFDSDADILHKVAAWINAIFHGKEKISGVLYLHDITLGRIRGSGLRNLEMLPKFLGHGQLGFCTLVTTHWGTLRDSSREVKNEEQLRKDDSYWKPLLDGYSRANMERFDNTDESALSIISQHLGHLFVPAITEEMVVQDLPLDHTGAGKIVNKNLEQAYSEAREQALRRARQGDSRPLLAVDQRYKRIKDRMRDKFDEERTLDFKRRSKQLRKKQLVHRAVRWVARGSTVAGVTTAMVFTAGAAAPALAALPLVEGWAQIWSSHDKEKRDLLLAEYNTPADREFRLYQKEYGLSEEDIAEMGSVPGDESDLDNPKWEALV